MASLIRTVTYVAVFAVLVVIVVPSDAPGLNRPDQQGAVQIVGATIILVGSVVAYGRFSHSPCAVGERHCHLIHHADSF